MRDAQFPTNYCWQHQPDIEQTKPAGTRAGGHRKPATKKKPAAKRGARR